MLRQVIKKLMALSAITLFALTLAMLNPSSRSWLPEAQAQPPMCADPLSWWVCYGICVNSCGDPPLPPYVDCPYWDAENWCNAECARLYC